MSKESKNATQNKGYEIHSICFGHDVACAGVCFMWFRDVPRLWRFLIDFAIQHGHTAPLAPKTAPQETRVDERRPNNPWLKTGPVSRHRACLPHGSSSLRPEPQRAKGCCPPAMKLLRQAPSLAIHNASCLHSGWCIITQLPDPMVLSQDCTQMSRHIANVWCDQTLAGVSYALDPRVIERLSCLAPP